MPKYTGCCCSTLKKISGKQHVCFIPTRLRFLLTLPEGLPSATLFQAPLRGCMRVSEGVQRAASAKGKTCHKPAPRPAWQELICTAPGAAGGGAGGRCRPSNPLKSKDLQQQPCCILHRQTKHSVMGLENCWHFTVPLWWLKKEGHTHQWTDHGTETTTF